MNLLIMISKHYFMDQPIIDRDLLARSKSACGLGYALDSHWSIGDGGVVGLRSTLIFIWYRVYRDLNFFSISL